MNGCLNFGPFPFGCFDTNNGKLTFGMPVGGHLVIAVESAHIFLEMNRLAGESNPSIRFNPMILDAGKHLPDCLPDDIQRLQTRQTLEGRIDGKVAVIGRFPRLIADDFMKRVAIHHSREKLTVVAFRFF